MIYDDGSGLMNLDGDDRKLTRLNPNSSDTGKGKKAVWIFSVNDYKVTLNLTITGTSNDGENTNLNAVVKVVKNGVEQTVAAKGFCGG